MKTITNACEMFYKAGSEVNGHIAECVRSLSAPIEPELIFVPIVR